MKKKVLMISLACMLLLLNGTGCGSPASDKSGAAQEEKETQAQEEENAELLTGSIM